jgi:hypothetical protein
MLSPGVLGVESGPVACRRQPLPPGLGPSGQTIPMSDQRTEMGMKRPRSGDGSHGGASLSQYCRSWAMMMFNLQMGRGGVKP